MSIVNKYVKFAFKKYVAPVAISLSALGSVASANVNDNAVDALNTTFPYNNLKSRITAIYDGTNDAGKNDT